MGSCILADFVPKNDSTVWACLQEAGAVLVVRCNLHEFAVAATYGKPDLVLAISPWNPDHVTGGSSSGSRWIRRGSRCVHGVD